MTGWQFWTLLLIIIGLSVPGVICRNDYAQYYISKYHKVSTVSTPVSTSESISSSRPGISSTIVASASSTGVSELKDKITSTEGISSEEKVFASEGGQITGPHGNETVLHNREFVTTVDSSNDFQTVFVVRIVLIVGSVIFFICVLGCIVCCCPRCRGRARTGFIVRNGQDQATGIYPQQPLIGQPPPPQTAVSVQHYPPDYSQQGIAQHYPQPYATPYPQAGQQQPQYSAVQPPPQPQYSPHDLQFYNPPEAPPPYEDKSSHKY